jgi:hypothetical protein
MQLTVLDSLPLLDAPSAICFICEKEGFKVRNLLKTIGIPIGIPRDELMQTCERCYSWQQIEGVPDRSKKRVIDAYHEAFQIEFYKLIGLVGRKVGGSGNCYAGLVENKTEFPAVDFDLKTAGDDVVMSAIYYQVTRE